MKTLRVKLKDGDRDKEIGAVLRKMNAPAEPRQKDLLTGRYRLIPRKRELESSIQIRLVAQLRGNIKKGIPGILRDDVIMFAIPNGEIRSPRTAAKLKAMGVLPGVLDLQFIWEGPNVLFLELKRPGGVRTDAQHEFSARARSMGAKVYVADSVDGALVVLNEHGILKS